MSNAVTVSAHSPSTAPPTMLSGAMALPVQPRKPSPGRSLAELVPALAAQWDLERNGALTAADVSPGSECKIWWRCRERADHIWLAAVNNRRYARCPFCSGRRADATRNLAHNDPDRARLWHLTKNGSLTPKDVTPGADRLVWWRCDRGPDHEWQARVCKQTRNCPFCANHQVSVTNSLATTHPKIARLWDGARNGSLAPRDVVAHSTKAVWWRCSDGPDHCWRRPVWQVVENGVCPFCSNRRASVTNSLATVAPEVAQRLEARKAELAELRHQRAREMYKTDPGLSQSSAVLCLSRP